MPPHGRAQMMKNQSVGLKYRPPNTADTHYRNQMVSNDMSTTESRPPSPHGSTRTAPPPAALPARTPSTVAAPEPRP